MATGTCVGPQGNLPLQGETERKQITAATDIDTITGASGQTGDFEVWRTFAGVEKAYLTSAGAMVASTLSAISSFGLFGKACVGTQSITSTAPGVTSGSFGYDSSANWIIAVNNLINIRTALINIGLITT
jgi:hypothetical protein